MKPVNEASKDEKTNVKPALTPEELIHRHMQNPDEPITDEDINNLIIDVDEKAIEEIAKERTEERDIIQTPYEILKP